MVWSVISKLSASPPLKWVVPICEPPDPHSNREAGGYIYPSAFLSLRAVPMGCPFGFLISKKMFLSPPLELLKHCIILPDDFWGVCAFFLLRRQINNGILEATSFRGWFKSNCPLFVYIDILSAQRVCNQ
jgi:hypothetical protein